MSLSSEQELIVGSVLATLAAEAGGIIEVSTDRAGAAANKFGNPAPLLIGRDEDGAFVACLQPDEVEERAWPLLQRILGGDEAEARAHAAALAAQMRATELQIARLKRELQRDAAAPGN